MTGGRHQLTHHLLYIVIVVLEVTLPWQVDDILLGVVVRHTRAVELTGAGAQLQRTVAPALERIDAAVRLVRQTAGRKSVAIATWASFASTWLIPRMEAFQRDHPDIDLRIDASDAPVDMDTADIDLALRYSLPGARMAGAERLFGEQLAVVASPWLLKSTLPVRAPVDVARFTLIEAGDAHRTQHLEWLSWRRWLDIHGVDKLQPERWLYFNYAHQIAQAALSGQGLALSRMPLIADALAAGTCWRCCPSTASTPRWPTGSWWAHAVHSAPKSRRFAPGWRRRLKSRVRPLAMGPTPTHRTTSTERPP